MILFEPLDARAVELLLCDADGNLFPSEDPAFAASASVTNRLLATLGADRTFSPDELRDWAMGQNFRATAQRLAAEHGARIDDEELEGWVATERREVVAHLEAVLGPDPDVAVPLERLARRYQVAVVSSSALSRLAACFRATDLEHLFPETLRFSAEDSLPVPTSKPDPAVYELARSELGIGGRAALAIEDSVAGVHSAVAAGFPTVGNLQFVARSERARRIDALRDAGVSAIVESWAELEQALDMGAPAAAGRVALEGTT